MGDVGFFVHFQNFALAGKRTNGVLGARGRDTGVNLVVGTCEGGGGGRGGRADGLVVLKALQAIGAENVTTSQHARAAGI